MDKMDSSSLDITKLNIEKIKELFPNVVTENKIDFDVLRNVLGDEVDDSKEKYQFTWKGKSAAIKIAQMPSTATLRPSKEDSKDWDTTENLYIEGDNLEVLKQLQKTYYGKIKMIYIDPPYNTGHDFVYKDDFKDSIENYKEQTNQTGKSNPETNGRYHTDWLNMKYPRLLLAKNLLRDDGVIYISIDDNEIDNLKKICNEVFGEVNFVAQIPWQSRASIQNDTDFSVNHEYICVYAKKRRLENRRLKESNYTEWYKKESFVCKPLPLDKSKFDNPDNDSRGLWKADPFDAPNIRTNLTYPVVNPNTGEQHLPPKGRCWRFLPEKFSSALEDNRIVWTNNGLGRPQLKIFYDEKKEFGSIDNSWFSAERIGTSTNGTKELMKLFEGSVLFDTPKPVSLLMKLITLANTDNDDIILDFFSGSATTAHAVMNLNTEDGKNRKFIMVQLPEMYDEKSEAYKTGLKNICEVGKERIRRAGEKIKDEWLKDNVSEGLFAEEQKEFPFDIGFKVFKLDSTNIYPWDNELEMDEKTLFKHTNEVFKQNRSKEDVLYEILLKYGVFDMNVSEININGKKMYLVGKRYMLVCLEDIISNDDIKSIIEQSPKTVVFKESGFKNDNDKINAIYNLEKAGVEDIKCI
ncbi:MAG: site-specific DNA-methyltransferase [Erysipelotrichaceae bacterium]